MHLMLLPILCIAFSQFLIMDQKEIFRILLLRSLRKIERPCYHGLAINYHDLVMCYGVLGVYFYRYASIREKSGRRIFIGSLALVQDNLHLYPSLMSTYQGFGNWGGGEGVGLDENGAFGFIQFPDDGICGSAVGGEVDLPVAGGGFFLGPYLYTYPIFV